MSPFDPKKPSMPETAIPIPEAEAEATVVAEPPRLTVRARDAIVRELVKEHDTFILATLAARKDLLPASAPDVRQGVLLVLTRHVERHGKAPDHVRGFLRGVIRNEICNHKQRWTPDVVPGASVEDKASSSRGPEGRADFAERSAKLEGYLRSLPEEEAAVLRCTDLLDMTIEETAAALQRAPSTVFNQRARAREKVKELGRASERATALGERRKKGG